MNKKHKIAIFILFSLTIAILVMLLLYGTTMGVLNPKGMIALKQRNLIIAVTLLMLIVVLPVFVLTFVFAWKYRASNKKAKYHPDLDQHLLAECIWWGIPCLIIIVIGILAWKGNQELDPFRPLDVSGKPITIQVVALQWKWLFIYPEQKIATVNFIQFPKETPINFEITADAPMNSFWIPELGGQIYAMPGMKTKLHLIASEIGSFRGSSANLSGVGFSGMRFIAKATSQEDFNRWVQSIKRSSKGLNKDTYNQLANPSKDNPVASYVLLENDLYDQIVMKYMKPTAMNSKDKVIK